MASRSLSSAAIDCSTCANAVLDASWVEETTEEVERLRRIARDARHAHDAVREATQRLASLRAIPTVSLPDATHLGLPADGVRAAWESWLEIPTDDLRDAAEQFEDQAPMLATAVADLRDAATEELAAREDRWTPLAERVAAWLEVARSAEVAATSRPTVDGAEQWLKSAIDDLRNERLDELAATQLRCAPSLKVVFHAADVNNRGLQAASGSP